MQAFQYCVKLVFLYPNTEDFPSKPGFAAQSVTCFIAAPCHQGLHSGKQHGGLRLNLECQRRSGGVASPHCATEKKLGDQRTEK